MALHMHTALPNRPPTTHFKKGGIGAPFEGPVCGQRAADGKGFARTLYTTDPTQVRCAKCRKALIKAGLLVDSPSPTTESTPA